MNSNKKLYILVAALAVLLVVTIALIFALRPGTDAAPSSPAQSEPTAQPTAEPQAAPTAEPEADDDPLAGLSEEEMGALAMAEENNEEDVDDPEAGAAD